MVAYLSQSTKCFKEGNIFGTATLHLKMTSDMQIRQTQCHHHIENVKELNEPSKSNSDIHNYIGVG